MFVPRSSLRPSTLALAGLALAHAPGAARAQSLTLIDPPAPLAPETPTYASAISDDGTTVVGQLGLLTGATHALRARLGPPLDVRDLGDLPGGLEFTSAEGVSADGALVVGTGYAEDFETGMVDGLQVAFRHTDRGGFVILGELAGGLFRALANDVSADGTIVVGASYDARNDFVGTWFTDPAVIALGTLPSSMARSTALACSADGRRVLMTSPRGTAGGGTETRAVVVDVSPANVAGPVVDIGDLFGGTGTVFGADLSADGRVVVGSAGSLNTGSNGVEAFRAVRDPTGAWRLQGLGDLPGGPFTSDALATSRDGSVVVGRSVVSDDEREEAFVWTSTRGLERLADVAARVGIALPPDLLLSQATGVSGDGLVIVGNAFTGIGAVRAFALSLPPDTFAPIAGADAGVGSPDAAPADGGALADGSSADAAASLDVGSSGDASAAVDTGASSGADSGAATDAATPTDAGTADAAVSPPDTDGGCACGSTTRAPDPTPLLLGAAWVWVRGRRRRA